MHRERGAAGWNTSGARRGGRRGRGGTGDVPGGKVQPLLSRDPLPRLAHSWKSPGSYPSRASTVATPADSRRSGRLSWRMRPNSSTWPEPLFHRLAPAYFHTARQRCRRHTEFRSHAARHSTHHASTPRRRRSGTRSWERSREANTAATNRAGSIIMRSAATAACSCASAPVPCGS